MREGGFLRGRAAIVLTIVLLCQAGVFYGFSRTEEMPVKEPLSQLPAQVGAWSMVQDLPIDEETLKILRADETLSRNYTGPSSAIPINLFVAFFNTQRKGQTPHSPKNCMPGSGWNPTTSDEIDIAVEGRGPIRVNRFIVANMDRKSVVLYWYQSRDRVVADEFSAKFYAVADAIRYNRTDTALVRVTVPVVDGDEASALEQATAFVKDFYSPLRQRLPA
jgi:EpsI family protein